MIFRVDTGELLLNGTKMRVFPCLIVSQLHDTVTKRGRWVPLLCSISLGTRGPFICTVRFCSFTPDIFTLRTISYTYQRPLLFLNCTPSDDKLLRICTSEHAWTTWLKKNQDPHVWRPLSFLESVRPWIYLALWKTRCSKHIVFWPWLYQEINIS